MICRVTYLILLIPLRAGFARQLIEYDKELFSDVYEKTPHRDLDFRVLFLRLYYKYDDGKDSDDDVREALKKGGGDFKRSHYYLFHSKPRSRIFSY